MTPEEIIDMAKEADVWVEEGFLFEDVLNAKTIAFAKLVASKEREACAQVCEEVGEHPSLTPQHCAESIRARGEA